MQKSIRLLKIWSLCRRRRMMTAPRLAQMCDVDERTVYRDLQALGEMGVKISSNGGYHVVSEDALPQLNLSSAEQLVITLALRNLPMHLDRELEDIANGALNKLLEQPVESSGIALDSTKTKPLKAGVFYRLQKAIEEHRLVTFLRYRKLTDEVVHGRTLEPYLLRFCERAWYLVAWSPSRQGFRIFRLDRIDKLRVEKQTFIPRPFDPEAFFRGSLGIMVDEPQHIRVRFTGLAKEIVKKDGRFKPAEMSENKGKLILATTIRGEIQWLRWILGFGGEAEILEPATLRQKAVEMIRAGLKRYQGRGHGA